MRQFRSRFKMAGNHMLAVTGPKRRIYAMPSTPSRLGFGRNSASPPSTPSSETSLRRARLSITSRGGSLPVRSTATPRKRPPRATARDARALNAGRDLTRARRATLVSWCRQNPVPSIGSFRRPLGCPPGSAPRSSDAWRTVLTTSQHPGSPAKPCNRCPLWRQLPPRSPTMKPPPSSPTTWT